MQITEIKCLSSGVGGELAPEAPGLPPSPTRFPATRSSASPLTALQIKVSWPKRALRASYHKPVTKMLKSGTSWLELLSLFEFRFNHPPRVFPISDGSSLTSAPSYNLVSIPSNSLTHKPAVSNT